MNTLYKFIDFQERHKFTLTLMIVVVVSLFDIAHGNSAYIHWFLFVMGIFYVIGHITNTLTGEVEPSRTPSNDSFHFQFGSKAINEFVLSNHDIFPDDIKKRVNSGESIAFSIVAESK